MLNSFSMLSAILVEYSSYEWHEPSGVRIHKIPLLMWKENIPHVDNLQKIDNSSLVKNNINFDNFKLSKQKNKHLCKYKILFSYQPHLTNYQTYQQYW